LQFTISATDPDGDALEYSAAGLPLGASFDSQTQSFSWTPNYDQAGTYNNIAFSVSDGNLSDTQTISIIVSNVNQPPQVTILSPSSGTSDPNQPVTFTTTYTDLDGWQNIKYVQFLVNTSTSSKNCFLGYYNQNTNRLFLRNDSNTAWLGGYAPGSSNIIENSYAQLDCSQTTVSGIDDTLTIEWRVIFKSSFAGGKNTYLYVIDDGNLYDGWRKKGTWTISNNAPFVGTIEPSSGESAADEPVSFITTYNDPDGWLNLKQASFLINTNVSGKDGFYSYYDQNANKLYLRNDSNTAWLGGYAPGSSNIIENSYAQLDCSQTTVSGIDDTLTIEWRVIFKSSFAGGKNTYLYVIDDGNLYDGWRKKGIWEIR
jgi:hypothetical protein